MNVECLLYIAMKCKCVFLLKKIIQSKSEEEIQEDWTHPVLLKGLHNDSRSEGTSRIDAAARVADLECASLRIRKETSGLSF